MANESPKAPQESVTAFMTRSEAAMDAWAREKEAYDRFDNALAAIETACDGLKHRIAGIRGRVDDGEMMPTAVEVQHGVSDWFIRLNLGDLTELAAKVDDAARATKEAEERR